MVKNVCIKIEYGRCDEKLIAQLTGHRITKTEAMAFFKSL